MTGVFIRYILQLNERDSLNDPSVLCIRANYEAHNNLPEAQLQRLR